MTTQVVRLSSPDAAASLAAVAAALRSADAPVAVVAGDLVVADAALAPLTVDAHARTAVLVRPGTGLPAGSTASAHGVRVRHHRATSVGTTFHGVSAPDHVSVGALVVGRSDVVAAQAIVADLASAVADGSVESDGTDLAELVALGLVRGGVEVAAVDLVDVPWFRAPVDAQAARVEADSVPAERIAQLQANRVDDGFYSTFVVRRLSKPLTRLALRLGWTPNAVTVLSFAIGLGAAASFAVGSRWALVLGAVLLQLSLIVDCVDGEVARATRRFSALGAWLDASTDRVKEYLAYAGLAVGAARSGVDLWWLALVLVVLQTTRHMTDYDFSRVQRMREATVPARDVRIADDGAEGATGGWSVSGAMEASSRMNRRDAVRWAKRAIHMPIGERWLVISVFAAVLGAAWGLGVLLALGLVALAYVMLGRTLRTLTWRGPTPDAGALLLARQADSGPVLALVSRAVPAAARARLWQHRAAWAVPAALRLVELGLVAVIALVWFPGLVVVAFWWVAVVAFHHYDTLYRALQHSAPPRWLTFVGLGWDGRTVVVVALAALGESALRSGLSVGACALAAWFVVVASVQWLAVSARGVSAASPGADEQ